MAADKIDETIISVVATISSPSPVPTIQSIADLITTQPWISSQLSGNKFFTNSEQQSSISRRTNSSTSSSTTLNHIDKSVPLTVANSSSSKRIVVDERNNGESFHVISSTELASTQMPSSIAVSLAMDSSGSGTHKSQISTSVSSNIQVGRKQLLISRVSTHSDTAPLAPSPKLNKIFDTLSAASKHHHHDHR